MIGVQEQTEARTLAPAVAATDGGRGELDARRLTRPAPPGESAADVSWTGSDAAPADQAERLRRLVRQTDGRARVLAVTSGKGGVGKTNVAANLALCLCAAGKRVILLDADLGLANLDVLLPVRARANLSQVIAGQRRLAEILTPGPGGLQMICGASGLTHLEELSEFQRRQLLQDLATLERLADLIVIDTAAGIGPNVISFCQAADHTLVVTTPEPTSLADAYAMIKTLTRRGSRRLSLLVNLVEDRSQAKHVYEKIAATAQRFLHATVANAGYVVRDEHVPQAVRRRQPVVLAYPRCPAAECFLALAQKLSRARLAPPTPDGFFRRLWTWFT